MPDFKKEPTSIEELESMLDEEFAVKDEEITKDDVVEETESEEEPDEKDEQDEEEQDEEESEEPLEEEEPSGEFDVVQTLPKKKTKDDKQAHAFKKLREEASALKTDIADLDVLAVSYGYKNYKELMETMKKDKLEKEAKEKNIDPELYKEMDALKKRLSQVEQEKKTQERQQKVVQFAYELDTLVKDEGLTPKEKDLIVQNLENDGYSLDDLLIVRNPKRLLKGYAADIIVERKVQKSLEKTKDKSKFVEEKFKNSDTIKDLDMDAEIKKELKKYAKEQGFSFPE